MEDGQASRKGEEGEGRKMAEGSKEEAAQGGGVDLRASSVAERVCGGSEKFELDLAGPRDYPTCGGVHTCASRDNVLWRT